MSIIYQNGLGDTLGDTLVTRRPLYASGNVWYVNSVGGVDAASPAGQNREKPLATLAQAVTNSANDDIIECLSGHAETIAAGINLNKRLIIVGGGSSAGRPTVTFTPNTTGNLFVCSSSNVQLRNLWIKSNAQTSATARITLLSNNFRMYGCYVECGATDTGAALSFDSSSVTNTRLFGSTFISTATVVTAQPESAIKLTAATSDLEIDALVLSAGTVGFSNYRAFDGSGFAITRVNAYNVSQLLGADVKLNAGSTGFWNTSTCTGGSRLDW